MPHFICSTCATQFAETAEVPKHCPICEDERQYIGWGGQSWTTLAELREKHRPGFREEEPGLLGIGMEPKFAIGQRALVVQTPAGNVLWDCIPLLNDEIVERVRSAGGLTAIAISHPHYYTSMVEWSRAFDAPIYLHAADREWVMRPDPCVNFWEGETRNLLPGVTLIRCGGHFEGGSVLHWAEGAEGRGVLLSGDILQVLPDRRYVSFMRSYPNLIPLPAESVRRIAKCVEPYPFERIYGAWFDLRVAADGNAAVKRSADRYVRALGG